MPWSAFLPAALTRAWPSWQQLRSRTLDASQQTNLFLIIWMLVPLLFFSLSTRQEYYVLPSLPPMILLIANLPRLIELIRRERHTSIATLWLIVRLLL